MENLPDNGVYPKDLYLKIREEIKQEVSKIENPEDRKAIVTAFRDPVIFRVFLITYTPIEDLALRSKLYRAFPPVKDNFYLGRALENIAVKRSRALSQFISFLKAYFRIVWMVDSQKQHGRPGSIAELRKNFHRESVSEDGTKTIEEDHWPFAKLRKTRNPRGEVRYEFHLLKKPRNKYEANNFFDMASIAMIQERHSILDWGTGDKGKLHELMTQEYRSARGENKVLVSFYDPQGKKLLEPFPLQLRDKYEGLIAKKVWSGKESREDFRQQAEMAFFEAVLNYPLERESPPDPPGYFRMAIKNRLSDLWEKSQPLPFDQPSPMAAQPDSILEDTLNDLLGKGAFPDEIDRIIAGNYAKSDREISEIIKSQTGKSLSRAAVQKRRGGIKEVLRGSLEIRRFIGQDAEEKERWRRSQSSRASTDDIAEEEEKEEGI